MAQFVAFMPGVEVCGEAVLAVVDGMGIFKDRAFKLLARNGISQPEAGQWYPQQAFLDSFRLIAETIGPVTLFAIGRKVPDNAQFPADIVGIEGALRAIDVAYHMNHRLAGQVLYNPRTRHVKEGIGHYHYKKVAEQRIQVICENPYPCDFDRGIIEAMALRHKPPGCLFVKVAHDDAAPCRKKGADSCTCYVEW
jgi:hypothetical protein